MLSLVVGRIRIASIFHMHQRSIVSGSKTGSITQKEARKAVEAAKSSGAISGSKSVSKLSATVVERFLGHFGSGPFSSKPTKKRAAKRAVAHRASKRTQTKRSLQKAS